MKKSILLSAFAFVFFTISTFAAVKTATTGNWNPSAGSNTSFASISTTTADSILVPTGVTVTVTGIVTCGALNIQSGGSVIYSSSSSRQILVVGGAGGNTGTVTIDGSLTTGNSNTQFIAWDGPTFTYGSGATYTFGGTTSSGDGGFHYTGTGSTTMTCNGKIIGPLLITTSGTVYISGDVNFRCQGTGGNGALNLAATSILNIPAASTVTLSANNATAVDITIASGGKINLDGIINNRAGTNGVLAGSGALTVKNGGKYIHNHTGTTLQGSVAGTVVWNTGSTCEIGGYTTGQTPGASFNQTFSNFNWNCTAQSGTINIASMTGAIVNGKFTLVSTNGQILRLNNNTTAFSLSTKDFEVQSGTLEFTGSGATSGTKEILVAGDFTQSGGTITESGTAPTQFTFNKLGTQVFSKSAGAISNNIDFIVNNGSTLTLASVLSVLGTATVNSGGILNTGDNLILSSNASSTGSIGNSAGTINGNVTLQRYIPGKRAFRFLAHPFSNTLNLSSLTDNILITGGPATGFTPTPPAHNPSAFWYSTDDGTESNTNDVGWAAFTTTDGTGGVGTGPGTAIGNGWSKYKGIRVLVRGTIADGLSPVTPSAVTIDATGTLNTGTQVIAVTKGTNSGFNFIGNPFASNINLTTVGGNVALGGNLVTNYYVWDVTVGKGAWVNNAFSSSYILPSFAGFIVKTSAVDNITITENAKTSTAATGTLFRTNNAPPEMVRLSITGNNINWDKFELYYSNDSKIAEDKNDGVKLFNSEVNFYSIQNGKNYSIDSRPFVKDDTIPMGFTSATLQNYTIKASEYNLPINVELYLRDKFLGTETKIAEGTTYTFSVTANAASQGNDRFELVQKQILALPTLGAATFSVKLSPNPTSDMVKVSFSNEEQASTTIILTNVEGKTVRTMDAGNVQTGQVSINVKGLAKGTYYVTLNNGKQTKTEKLQVQ